MLLTHEEFFLYTVEDLRNKLKENTTYSIMRACGLCRQLVEDKNWLLNEINKKLNADISFTILDVNRNILKANIPLIWLTINPFFGNTKQVNRDDLLKTEILRINSHIYNVRDIIKIVSNKMGGIHSEEPHPNNRKYLSFYDFDKATEMDYSSTLNSINAIVTVILKTSEKLESLIK